MTPFRRSWFYVLLMWGMGQGAQAQSDDAELQALSLEGAPAVVLDARQDGVRVSIEAALGSTQPRASVGRRDFQRLSLDFSASAQLGSGLRAVLSDRLDYFNPASTASSVNSLREAYVSWQPEAGHALLEAGRINLRYGPGYGYNPTDFFRDGSLRTLTTVNPIALRENRMGSVMVRAQRLWSDGALAVAYSPRLADQPSQDGWALDLGSTNHRDRGLLVLSTRWSPAFSSQASFYKEAGSTTAVGVSATALLSDAAVAHGEWTRSHEPTLLSRALGRPDDAITRNRFVGGVTYTTQSKLSVTAEYQYNGFALDSGAWTALGATPALQAAYVSESQRRLDLAPRQAYLIYLTQKDMGLKNLDLSAMWRVNRVDHSRLFWVELRHHWSQFDLSVQYQHNAGQTGTELGLLPERHLVQVMGVLFY